ncbi:MAG: hypothetical protein CMP49_06400 [Flavobacteriales bacterium]|nr:hypothetical protein [Flavobacteriales bacterium]
MKKKNSTEKQFANIEEGLSKTEQFIEDNRKILFSIIGVIIFIFIAYYGYENLYKKPLNKKAQKQLFIAEQYFEKDSFNIALNGNDKFIGLKDIIKEFGSTKSGAIAKYYAGISYLNIGEYKNAIEVLDKFKSTDKLLMSIAKTAIGDAFSEINQPNEAIEYYEAAISIYENQLTTPIILIKSAKIHEKNQDFDKARICYEVIKNKYPKSETAKNIDKYINYLNNLNNQ